MDPNKTLRQILMIIQNPKEYQNPSRQLSKNLRYLAEWIDKGGFFPECHTAWDYLSTIYTTIDDDNF